jgi:hypothetical protein
MNKYEKLIELIINENEEQARDLFHEIVLEKSRSIYESLMDDESEVSTDQVADLADDVTADEEGVNEEEDEEGDDEEGFEIGDEDDEEDDMAMDTGEEADDTEPATKGDIMDIESAIDELKAEFDKIMGIVDADGDGDHDMEDHDMEAEPDMDMEMPAEEGIQFEEEETSVDEELEEDSVDEEDSGDADLAQLREYVEKVAGVKAGDNGANAKSVVAGKNDMGGTTANIVPGGDESGAKAPAAKPIATGNRNVPGGKANSLEAAPKAKSGE